MTKIHPNTERRTYPRVLVDLRGKIRINGNDSLPCRIRDLCRNGLRFECPELNYEPTRPSDEPVLIRFELPHGGVQGRVQVVQGADGAFGARFLGLSTASITLLMDYLQARAPTTTGPVAGDNAQTAQRVLQRMTPQCLDDLIGSLLEGMQEALWTSSERASNDLERSALTGDIVLLEHAVRQHRFQDEVRQALLVSIVLHLEGNGQTGDTPQKSAPPDLELVDPEGFDLWLAVSALTGRLERRLDDSLRPLRALSTAVFGAGTVLSIEPQGITQALRQALVTTGMEIQGQLLCLRAAGEQLPRHLAACYQALLDAWADEGLTPQPMPATRARGSTPPRRLPGVSPATSSPRQPAGSPLSNGDTRPKGSQPGSALSAQDLSELLLGAVSTATPGAALGARIQALLPVDATGTPTALPPRLDERVEITDRLLTHVLKDPMLSNGTKDLVQRLSLRFLAAAVNEPEFFTTADHPLVNLIDQLEHLSMFLPRDVTQRTPAQRALEQLIQQILTTDTRNSQALRDLSDRLVGLQQRLGGELQRSAERVAAGNEGRERVREARRQVRVRLNETFAGRSMHPAVADLVQCAWRTLLQLIWVREGGDGATWQRYWQVLLDLHRACSGVDQGITTTKTAALLELVQEGLGFIGFDPYQRTLLDQQIEAALREAGSGVQSTVEQTVFEALPPDADERREESTPEGVDALEWAHALAKVNGLPMGAILRLREGDTEFSLRLVWRSGDGGELVFIDPSSLESKALERGALTRAFQRSDAQILPPSEQSLTGRAMDATLREMQERLQYHETHDSLTHLRNRRQLIGVLTQLLTMKPDDFTNQVLGFLELNRFDALTSACGYSAGECLLVAVARLLQNLLEQATCLAYLGGNRFAFLLPAADAAAAEQIGQSICTNLTAMPFYWDETAYQMPGSIGLVLVTAAAENPEALLSAADIACRTAQRDDAGQVVLFQEGNADIARHQARMRGWIQVEAVVKGERLRLRGQRIAVTTAPTEISHHYEVLLSVYDEQGAPLPLDAFISAAEAFNLMADMDQLVLNKALDWVHTHPTQARALGGIAINLSGQSMGDLGLVDHIRDALQRLAIPPELISFEVTETATIANLDQAAAIIKGIKALGCCFALDDFGSGLSSYSYLKRLPMDYIKIDGSFVKEIVHSPHDHAIVKSINEIAHFMGKKTIAEYVENLEILQQLREIGVDYVQGYAVEKPCFLDEIGDGPL